MSQEILNCPGVSRRMKILCVNCQWLEQDYDHCNELRKGFDCTKYQVKKEIEDKREKDASLTTQFGWLGSAGADPVDPPPRPLASRPRVQRPIARSEPELAAASPL